MISKTAIIHSDTKNYQRFTGVVAEAERPNFWIAALRGECSELLHEGYIYSNPIRRLIPAEIPAFGNNNSASGASLFGEHKFV
jgi:hypothetical protein